MDNNFDINKYIKQGFDIVIELDDEVEYLLNSQAVESLRNKEETVILIRLVDRVPILKKSSEIIKSLRETGVIDFLKSA